MQKTVLIGNGINIANGNYFFDINSVSVRFWNLIKARINFFEKCLYLDKTDLIELESFVFSDNKGIEQLSGRVYDYYKGKLVKKGKFNWNYCYRLIELLGCISIESLFIINNNFYKPFISEKYVKKLKSFDKVFTLNYVEDWDDEERCIFLHGNVSRYLNEYNGQMVYTNILSHTSEIDIGNEACINLDLKDIIFVPTNDLVTKQDYVGDGLYFNKCGLDIYPANDLFGYNGKGDIYQVLEELEQIEIFVVSPYGDNSLIEKLSKINDVTIYIYNKSDDNKELLEWKKFIPHANFKDSKEFLS